MDNFHAEKLNMRAPMAKARYVRRERYAWPGGYTLALLVDDGALLCPDCIAEHNGSIAYAVRKCAARSGFYPCAIVAECGIDGTHHCAHCQRVIFGGDE